MTYILEALKKAEQERDMGAVPNLATPHEVGRPQTRSYGWLWVIVALLSVNAALLVLLLNDRDAEVGVTAQAPPERSPRPMDDPSAQLIEQPGAAASGESPIPEKTVLPETEQMLPGGELVVLPEPVNLQDSKPLLRAGEERAERVDPATSAKDFSPPRSWYELPQEFRNKINLPRLDLHAYSDEPRNRFIMVNLKKYREGEELESGLILQEILPDGMVMSYQGERFLVEK